MRFLANKVIVYFLFAGVIICSCNQKDAGLNIQTLQKIEQETANEFKADSVDETTVFEDIAGIYELVDGSTIIEGNQVEKDFKGAMIIEKLSDVDYGYYEVIKVKDHSPIGHFGIVRRVGKNYYNLGICSPPVEYESKATFTSGVYIHNPVIIKKKGDYIGIIRYGSNFRSRQLFKIKPPETDFYISLKRTLHSTKQDYEIYLEDYRKALAYHQEKLQVAFFLENQKWKTKHVHNEIDTSYTITISYQSPNQNEDVLEGDSIFMGGF